MERGRPQPLLRLPSHRSPEGTEETELDLLRLLADCGLAVADMVVVPWEAEEEFYRLNNLRSRLESLFAAVDLSMDLGGPDDEDIEDLAPEARRLLEGHYLLDEFIDAFYSSIEGLPARLSVRRPDGEGYVCTRGRPCLLGLKRIWGRQWSFDTLWQRLSSGEALIPEPRPVLVHPASAERASAELELDAAAILGRPVELLTVHDSAITGVRVARG